MDLTKYYPDIAAKYPAYVTQRELCEICRICPKTAYNLEQQGEIPYTIEQNHLIRSHKIKLTDILAYLYRRECRQEADSPYICAMRTFYDKHLSPYSDLLSVKDIQQIIITYLGMGIVWFTDPPEQPEPTDYDYEYRVDTDVITPVTLYAGSEINPDSPATVSFTINGSTYRMNNIVIPSGDSQIAWVKWHTPSEPQDITIYVSTNKGSLSQSTIQAKVVDLSGNDPPDPKATDTMGSWTASSVPSRETKTYAAWSVWWARWHPYWVWHSTGDDDGYWVDEGWYDFFRDNYSASMTATTRIEPDEKVPTASGDLMKSGYSVL